MYVCMHAHYCICVCMRVPLYVCKYEWMDRWMDEWMLGGLIDAWMYGRADIRPYISVSVLYISVSVGLSFVLLPRYGRKSGELIFN